MREVQEKIYELAAALKFDGLLEPALAKIHAAHAGRLESEYNLPHAVVAYAVTVSPYRVAVARELLNSGAPEVVYGALEGLRADPALAKDLISLDWLNEGRFPQIGAVAHSRLWRLVFAETKARKSFTASEAEASAAQSSVAPHGRNYAWAELMKRVWAHPTNYIVRRRNVCAG